MHVQSNESHLEVMSYSKQSIFSLSASTSIKSSNYCPEFLNWKALDVFIFVAAWNENIFVFIFFILNKKPHCTKKKTLITGKAFAWNDEKKTNWAPLSEHLLFPFRESFLLLDFCRRFFSRFRKKLKYFFCLQQHQMDAKKF